jgi:hypothetical protein
VPILSVDRGVSGECLSDRANNFGFIGRGVIHSPAVHAGNRKR